MQEKQKIIVVLGPTASGKSALALELAKAFNGFLIAADSRQIYRDMNIITGKDEGEWRMVNQEHGFYVDGIQEFMVDVINPDEAFSVHEYQQQVFDIIDHERACATIEGREPRLPIIVGGTGLYISAVVDNYLLQGAVDREIRAQLENDLTEKGLDYLVNQLQELDPETAEEIDTENPRRVVRALEQVIAQGEAIAHDIGTAPPKYDVLQIGIEWPRDALYDRINRRIDGMLEHGGWHEVREIMARYGDSLNAVSSIGYKQLAAALDGSMSKEEAIETFKRDSRRYAKRQLTWFKRDERIQWVKSSARDQAHELVADFLK
jgi:tRNA dimethylallyltransferase